MYNKKYKSDQFLYNLFIFQVNLTASQKEIISSYYSERYKMEHEDAANYLYNVFPTSGRKKYHIYMILVEYRGRFLEYNTKNFVGEITD